MTGKPLNILAFDTSLQGLSVGALNQEGGKHASYVDDEPRGQAEKLIPVAQDVLQECGIGFDDLDMIVTTKGPGAFTGLRIGLSSAKTFAMFPDVRAIGIPTLEAVAYDVMHRGNITGKFAVIGETKRRDFYIQIFDEGGKPVSEPEAKEIEDIEQMLGPDELTLAGDGVSRFLDTSQREWNIQYLPDFSVIDPQSLCHMGLDIFTNGMQDNFDLEPIYLRGADVSVSKQKFRKIEGSFA